MILTILFKSLLLIHFNHPPQDLTTNVTKSFLIIHSSMHYNSALKKAQSAANKLGVPMNLRGMYQHETEGLATSEICGCGENHGYFPRGRYDDGTYISIEYSSSYSNFTPGYYIVIIASGERKTLNEYLPKVKAIYADAYVKNCDVYMGCMH